MSLAFTEVSSPRSALDWPYWRINSNCPNLTGCAVRKMARVQWSCVRGGFVEESTSKEGRHNIRRDYSWYIRSRRISRGKFPPVSPQIRVRMRSTPQQGAHRLRRPRRWLCERRCCQRSPWGYELFLELRWRASWEYVIRCMSRLQCIV